MKWSDINYVVSPTTPIRWQDRGQLAQELDTLCSHLDVVGCQMLVEAAHSGLPIILTWDSNPSGVGTVERTRTTVLVETVTVPTRPNPAWPGGARLRYHGFRHYVSLDQIIDIRYPPVETTYHRPEDGR